jgi:hypothetical protein
MRSNFIQEIGLQNPHNFPQEEGRGVCKISATSQEDTRTEEGVETKGKGPREKGPLYVRNFNELGEPWGRGQRPGWPPREAERGRRT